MLLELVGFWQTAELSFGPQEVWLSRADNDRDIIFTVVAAMFAVSSATCSMPRSWMLLHCWLASDSRASFIFVWSLSVTLSLDV